MLETTYTRGRIVEVGTRIGAGTAEQQHCLAVQPRHLQLQDFLFLRGEGNHSHIAVAGWGMKEEAKGAIYSENNSEKRGRIMLKNQLVDGLKMSQVFMFLSTILGKYLGWLVEITRIFWCENHQPNSSPSKKVLRKSKRAPNVWCWVCGRLQGKKCFDTWEILGVCCRSDNKKNWGVLASILGF